MSLSLHTIAPASGAKKPKKRIGRGGKRGTYSGKGLKGQKARSGASGLVRLGMRQLVEQTPKLRGFKSRNTKPALVKLDDLNNVFKDGDKVDLKTLQKKGIIDDKSKQAKVLSQGQIDKKIELIGLKVSATAKEKIEKAGGKIN